MLGSAKSGLQWTGGVLGLLSREQVGGGVGGGVVGGAVEKVAPAQHDPLVAAGMRSW